MEHKLSEGIYRILRRGDDEAVIELCDATHPVFKAHFEGNPLLPGFMQLDIAAELFGLEIEAIDAAKFLKMITPTMQLRFERTQMPKNSRIRLFNAQGEVCSDFRVKAYALA